MKNKKYHTVGTIPKYNKKIVERGKMDTLNTQEKTISEFYNKLLIFRAFSFFIIENNNKNIINMKESIQVSYRILKYKKTR
jgi:hypothetical protein